LFAVRINRFNLSIFHSAHLWNPSN
jgi:hypothetical protein